MKKIFVVILFLLCFVPIKSFAADISFNSGKNSFALGENFLVQVFLDTKGLSMNAIEGTISFSSEFLALKEIRDGNSTINFWVEKPHDGGAGKIVFSGIATGGISGGRLFLFGMILEAKKSGDSLISFDNIKILQNDGLGTEMKTTENPFRFLISTKVGGFNNLDLRVKDTSLPEVFVPFITKEAGIFDNKNFVVFSTVDKGSGIDHYEISENPWFFFGIWKEKYLVVESPYILKDQTLKSVIYIKAIDKNGNERVVEIGAQNKLAYFLRGLIIVIILIACIFILKKIQQKYYYL